MCSLHDCFNAYIHSSSTCADNNLLCRTKSKTCEDELGTLHLHILMCEFVSHDKTQTGHWLVSKEAEGHFCLWKRKGWFLPNLSFHCWPPPPLLLLTSADFPPSMKSGGGALKGLLQQWELGKSYSSRSASQVGLMGYKTISTKNSHPNSVIRLQMR